MNQARAYARMLATFALAHSPESAMARMNQFLLDHGVEKVGAPKLKGVRYGLPKLCFKNAMTLALDRKDLIYMEGYGAWHIPTLHAWCVTPEGRVVDPTWRYPAGEAPQIHYFGVPIAIEFALATILKADAYGVLAAAHGPLRAAPPETWRDARASLPGS